MSPLLRQILLIQSECHFPLGLAGLERGAKPKCSGSRLVHPAFPRHRTPAVLQDRTLTRTPWLQSRNVAPLLQLGGRAIYSRMSQGHGDRAQSWQNHSHSAQCCNPGTSQACRKDRQERGDHIAGQTGTPTFSIQKDLL